MSPYEYHNDKLGVQGRFLFDGRNAHDDSLRLIGERGLQLKIKRGSIIKLRTQGPGVPMLVEFRTLPVQWKNLCIQAFGEAPAQARLSWCERYYERDGAAFNFFNTHGDDHGALDKPIIEQLTINASVLNLVQKLYDKRYQYRKTTRQAVHTNGKIPSVRDTIASDNACPTRAKSKGLNRHTVDVSVCPA